MADEANEQQEALIPTEEVVPQEDTTVDQDVELDVEALKQKAEKADEYKKYADRVAAENKTLKKSLPTNQSSPDINERIERQDLRIEGYSKEEVEFLMQNGGQKALDNKLVLAGIEAMRKETKSKEATPSGTGKSAVYQKFTEQDLRKMPAEDLEKIIPQ